MAHDPVKAEPRASIVSLIVSRVRFFEAKRDKAGKDGKHCALILQGFDEVGENGKKPENVVLRL